MSKWHPDFENPIKINCKAGDFVIWDSQTFHCNTPALKCEDKFPLRVERIVAYINMIPYDLVTE